MRENNGFTNQTVTYTYDVWGNLTAKSVYAYTTATDPGTPISTISYGYSTGDWKDQLVSYDNQTIAYDAMGNPTTYRGKTLTWRGKQLTGIADGTDMIAYSYDENGLRLQKTVNNVVTDYYYNGKVLIGLTKGTDTLRFSYDAAGNAAAVDHNGTYYYYLRNGQGDIVKLIDGNGATVVEYTYDSWGKQLSCTGTLATSLGVLNPFRYRGYVYDEETGFYYLKSRYYDPETCRFISADVLLSTGQGVLGHNSFTYCGNNPIGRIDSEGELWNIIIGAIAGAVIGAIDAAINPDATASDIVKGALIGAATGAVVGATLGFGTALVAAEVVTPVVGATIATVGGALASGTGELVRQNAFNEERDWGKIGVATVAGGVGNLAGFGIGRFVSKTVKGLEAVVKKPLATMVKTLTSKGANATAERLINLVISDLWIAPMQSATMRIVSSLR